MTVLNARVKGMLEFVPGDHHWVRAGPLNADAQLSLIHFPFAA
jgi:hypothetical protein